MFKGVTSGMTTVSGVNRGSRFASWTAPPGNNIGPLGNSIFATGLSGAGIQTGFNVTLIGISANATIVSESTAYDRTLDTLRTSGFYTLTDPGSTFGTYRVTAEFTSLFNPDGNQLTGTQTLDATAQIGTVTPAPTSFILLTSGLLSFAGLHCRRVWLRTQVVAKV